MPIGFDPRDAEGSWLAVGRLPKSYSDRDVAPYERPSAHKTN